VGQEKFMDDEERSDKVMEVYDRVTSDVGVSLESAVDITLDLICRLQERHEALKDDLRRKAGV
jgi:hypothetical protein